MYLTATRPDMMFGADQIPKYMAKPTELHLQAAKRTFQIRKGNHKIWDFEQEGEEELLAFMDSDYAGDDADYRDSMSGYVFLLSAGATSWMSKKQPIVVLSITETEFVATLVCLPGILNEENFRGVAS